MNNSSTAIIAQLKDQLNTSEMQRVAAVSLLVSILRDKHSGKTAIKTSTLKECQTHPYQISMADNGSLGTVTLWVADKDGLPVVQSDAAPTEGPKTPQLLVPKTMLEPVEPVERCPGCARTIGHNLDCPEKDTWTPTSN